MRQNLKSSRRLCHPCWWPWRRLAGRWEGQAPSQDATGRAGELDNAWTWVAARARALGKNRKDKATSTQTSAHGNRPPVYTNSADTHPRARTKPVPRAKLPLNTSERNTNKQTNDTTTAPYTEQAAPAPPRTPWHKRNPQPPHIVRTTLFPPTTGCNAPNSPPPIPCLRKRTRRRRHAWPTPPRSARKRAHTRLRQKTPPLPAPNNRHQIRPIPPRNDRHLFRKASTHLRPHAARPWPRAGPKKGAGIRPKKRVTKYVHRQLGDTDRDSKLGPPHGPQKDALRQAWPPVPARPHGARRNTPNPPTQHSNAKEHHNYDRLHAHRPARSCHHACAGPTWTPHKTG